MNRMKNSVLQSVTAIDSDPPAHAISVSGGGGHLDSRRRPLTE